MNGLPEWVQIVRDLGAVGVCVLIGWLWLTGVLVRGKDVDIRLTERDEAHDRETALIHDAHADALTALNLAHDNRVRQLLAQHEADVADRDAWREAYSEEAGGRRAAEAATRQVMESGNVTTALLAALKDAMARTPPR